MCVLTRDTVIDVLSRITVAPITRTVRGIHSEVPVGLRRIRNHREARVDVPLVQGVIAAAGEALWMGVYPL